MLWLPFHSTSAAHLGLTSSTLSSSGTNRSTWNPLLFKYTLVFCQSFPISMSLLTDTVIIFSFLIPLLFPILLVLLKLLPYLSVQTPLNCFLFSILLLFCALYPSVSLSDYIFENIVVTSLMKVCHLTLWSYSKCLRVCSPTVYRLQLWKNAMPVHFQRPLDVPWCFS